MTYILHMQLAHHLIVCLRFRFAAPKGCASRPLRKPVAPLGVIFEGSLFSNLDLTRRVKKSNKSNLSD